MMDKNQTPVDTKALRQKAEDTLKSRSLPIPGDIAALPPEQIQEMVHELRVHQIELEIQNEELQAAQAELEESRSRYFDLYDMAPVGYCTISEKGLILEANLTAAAMLDTARSALVRLPISRFILKADQDIYYLHRKQLFETAEPQECELRMVKPDGTVFWVDLIATAARAEDGAPSCRAVISDITGRKQAAEERKKLETQLHQAQKMESVGRLAGGVAHDFNNMLGVILGHVEFAFEKAEGNQELYADLKEIQTAATRSADITKQLLAFARKQAISPRQLDVNDAVENMLKMLRRLIGEDIDLAWQPGAHLWPVKMDPSQIDQILANLCINARDAISGVGKLTIETGRKSFDGEYCSDHPGFIPGDFVLLAVSDNGSGMDKDTLENLFEPFFTTKDVGKGTGLGLATIYGIVKQNNGFINVYSEPGQGSIFKIYLPRLIVEKDLDKAAPEKKTAAGGSETILLVEDEPTILRMTRMMLERKGYTVLSAATPGAAVEKAKNHSGTIDMLMTDVVMPEMNGRDLAGQIIDLYPGIRLLFMSGYTASVIAHQGVLDETVAFIQKPFSMADLTMKVREVLDK